MQAAGSEAEVKGILTDTLGYKHVRMAQRFQGLPVIGGELIVHINDQNVIYQISGKYLPAIKVSVEPSIDPEAALQIGLDEHQAKPGLRVSKEPSLVIYGTHLAYHYVISYEGAEVGQWWYYVDAHTGELIFRYNNIKLGAPTEGLGVHTTVSGNRLVLEDGTSVSMTGFWENSGSIKYFLYNFNELWGIYDEVVGDWEQRSTSNWGTTDLDAVSGGNNFEIIQDYVATVLGRNSFDGAGAFAQANVHTTYGYCPNNAWYDGTDFHFCEGDGFNTGPWPVLDVAAHEYGHAITDHTSDLIYSYESGALNESYSDIFGTTVEFWAQPDGTGAYPNEIPGYSDWLNAEDVFINSYRVAGRDLRNPQRYQQPSYYHGTFWYTGPLDNGGVHTNSGVQNFAYYLLAVGGSGDNDGHPYGPIAGIGEAGAAAVAMRANMVYLTPSSQYIDSREAWISAASDLGYDTATVEQVWDAVGVVIPLEEEKLMVVRKRTDGKYKFQIYDVPTEVGGNTGLAIASDNNIGWNVMDVAGGEYDTNAGDELVVMRGTPGSTSIEKLFVYNMPDSVGGNTGPAIASDKNIGKTNRYMTVGNFDGDSDTELAVVRYVSAKDIYRLHIFDMPTTVGGDTGLAIASDRNIGRNIIGIAAANFDSDSEDELVVVRRKANATHRLQIYDVPTTVGGNMEPPIASDDNIWKNIIPYGVAVGNFDDDPEPEVAVVRLLTSGNHKLVIYDAPASVGGDTGPPIATDNNIGKNITAIAACEFVGECSGELYYDTGTPDHYWGGGDVGYAIALRFTPPSYPWTFDLAKFWPYSGSETLDIEVHVWDDDGPGGLPGSDLITPITHLCSATESWDNVSLPSITVDSGEFYIGWLQTTANTYYNGDDDDESSDGRSYVRFSDGTWYNFLDLGIYDNMMIRQGCQSMPAAEVQTVVPEAAGPASKLSEW
jgi:Zn-dependent metalloprotease